MDLNTVENIYFVGIGGIGMSALARYFNASGVCVYGYDKNQTELTKALEAEGINIVYEEGEKLPTTFTGYSSKNLVVYTPAIPKDNKILKALTQNYKPYKRAQILGMLSANLPTLAIAGTHGKTTTSILLAHLLQTAKVPIVAFLGGIAKNFNSNLVLSKTPQFLVTEADEFDRSFLTLHPKIAVITSTDADHLDIYNNKETINEAYQQFASQVTNLITKPTLINELNHTNVNTYSINQPADAQLLDYKIDNHLATAKFKIEDQIFDVQLNYPGLHNAENTLAAAYVAFKCGVSVEDLQKGIATFMGVKRRFEFHIKTNNLIFIDDYAHHPTEIEATLNAIKQLYPDFELTVIFQPHLFTRTRDFKTEFAQALSIADKVAILPIYPARELPIEGVTSFSIAEHINKSKVDVITKSDIETYLNKTKPKLLVTMGAGDIDKQLNSIKSVLLKQNAISI
jgi:UDP-N-acetylmuramate--alanine ligase